MRRARRLVVLCDVSRSMRPYAAPALGLLWAASSAGGEVFTFASELTLVTPDMGSSGPAGAIRRTAGAVDDPFGGTRIAASVEAVLRPPHRPVTLAAVGVVISDGWDGDSPAQLARAIEKLRRSVHRLVWLNPRAGWAGYRPDVAALQAALPHCDAHLPAGTVNELVHSVALLTAEEMPASPCTAMTRAAL